MRRIYLATWILLGVSVVSLVYGADPDPRIAKVKDAAGAESTVKHLKVDEIDDRRFDVRLGERVMLIVVVTKDFEYAIPLRAITSIEGAGQNIWTVRYRSEDSDLILMGRLADAKLKGESDFGEFTLPVTKLKRLEFQEPGIKTSITPKGDKADIFNGVLVLKDGTSASVTNLKRHALNRISGSDDRYIPPKPYSFTSDDHYVDLTFLRGETKQEIKFDRIKQVEFSPDGNVIVTTKSGAVAEMKLLADGGSSLTGFTGTSAKGNFYISLKFVKSISFSSDAQTK